jgi:hypothetical protein
MQLGGVQLGNEGISEKLQEPSSAEAGVSHLVYGMIPIECATYSTTISSLQGIKLRQTISYV